MQLVHPASPVVKGTANHVRCIHMEFLHEPGAKVGGGSHCPFRTGTSQSLEKGDIPNPVTFQSSVICLHSMTRSN